MEELYEKVENLIVSIDDSNLVKDIKDLNKKIDNDKELIELLNKYHQTKDEKLKEEILSNDLFQEYKSKETDLNILIMSLNQKFKTINSERSCSK